MILDPEETHFIALDFETSGFAAYSACSLGMCRIENLKIVDNWYSLIRPPSSNVRFSHIHGLYWKDLKEHKDFHGVWPEIEQFISGCDFLVAHNAAFDRSVLAGSCRYFEIPCPDKPFLCTLKGSRKKLSLKSRSLASVCSHLNIPLKHHNAISDALACAQIAIYLFNEGTTIEELLLKRKKCKLP